MKIAFIGLGVMGAPMAGHLAAAGYDLTVFNRSAGKTERWLTKHGGRAAGSLTEAVREADLVFTCVTDDEATRAVASEAVRAMRDGAVLVDHTSAAPSTARELAAMADGHGIGFLDAPVTGGEPGALAGRLGIMVGGDPAALAAAEPAMHSYAREIRHMGPVGAGLLSKLVNVIIAAGFGEAVAEGIGFARRAGLNLPGLVEVLSQGSSRSWVLEHKGPAMISGDYRQGSFSVEQILQVIGTARGEATHYGLDLPLLDLLEARYRVLRDQGGGTWDSASLIHLV